MSLMTPVEKNPGQQRGRSGSGKAAPVGGPAGHSVAGRPGARALLHGSPEDARGPVSRDDPDNRLGGRTLRGAVLTLARVRWPGTGREGSNGRGWTRGPRGPGKKSASAFRCGRMHRRAINKGVTVSPSDLRFKRHRGPPPTPPPARGRLPSGSPRAWLPTLTEAKVTFRSL